MKIKIFFLVSPFLLISFVSISSSAIQGVYRGRKIERIETRYEVLESYKLKISDLTLNDSTLADAQSSLGAAKISERPYMYSSYTSQVCYEREGIVVLLDSYNWRDRPQEIGRMIISADKNINEKFSKCGFSQKINKDVEFLNGLKLGMTRPEIEKIWGKPGFADNKTMIFEIRRIQTDYFTDDVSIYLEFNNGRLSFVDAARAAIR
jgi:hypothetical protein